MPDTIVVLIPSLVADSFFTILQRLTPRFARLKKLGARRWRYGSAASAASARTTLIHEIFDIGARRIASNHEGRISKYIVAALHAAVRYGVACASFPIAVTIVREALGASRVKSFKIRRCCARATETCEEFVSARRIDGRTQLRTATKGSRRSVALLESEKEHFIRSVYFRLFFRRVFGHFIVKIGLDGKKSIRTVPVRGGGVAERAYLIRDARAVVPERSLLSKSTLNGGMTVSPKNKKARFFQENSGNYCISANS